MKSKSQKNPEGSLILLLLLSLFHFFANNMETTTSLTVYQEQKTEDHPAVASSEHINLRVVAHDGGEVYFKIKQSTTLGKLMAAYCDRQSISPNAIRFLFDGQRLKDHQTPKDLNMEDNDIIDAALQQTVCTNSLSLFFMYD